VEADELADVLITDTKSDLNVYLDIGEDGEKKGNCCAPATPQAGDGCIGAMPVSCCAVPAEKVGESANKTGVAAEKTDLNEWVGGWSLSGLDGDCLTMSRFFQGLRRQGLRKLREPKLVSLSVQSFETIW